MRTLLSSAAVAALVITLSGGANASAELDAAGPTGSVERAGRAVFVVAPETYDDLVAHDVEIADVGGRASTVPFRDTVKIKLPIKTADAGGVTLDGGIRLSSDQSQLTLRNIVIPASGFVTGTVRGSEIGDLGRSSLFIQARSDSELGDTSLRFTFTLASYVNESFDTDVAELDVFGYETNHLR